MKSKVIFAVVLIALTACKKDELNTSESSFIYGDLKYVNLLTDEDIETVPDAVSKVELDEGTVNVDWAKLESTGETIVLGPLDPGTYQVESTFTDSETGLKFESMTEAIVSDIGVYLPTITLEPTYDYTLRCQITDSLGGPLQGVKVYLYSNYDYLSNYRGNETAAMKVSETNAKGRVLFTGLSGVPHFIYAERIIPTGEASADTLHSFIDSFDPEEVSALEETTLNEIPVIVK